MLKDLKRGGTFLLNSLWSDDEIGDNLPAKVKRDLAKKKYKILRYKCVEDSRGYRSGKQDQYGNAGCIL